MHYNSNTKTLSQIASPGLKSKKHDKTGHAVKAKRG